MLKINANIFKKVNFFLSNRKEVNSLEEAKEYGGVTRLNGRFYSNYKQDDNITLKNGINELSVIVPSTINADTHIDNKEYVKKYLSLLAEKYSNIKTEKSVGSWYSDDLNKVIIEKNSIITISVKEASIEDINYLLELGIKIKNDMTQEAVSVLINDSLCLV